MHEDFNEDELMDQADIEALENLILSPDFRIERPKAPDTTRRIRVAA